MRWARARRAKLAVISVSVLLAVVVCLGLALAARHQKAARRDEDELCASFFPHYGLTPSYEYPYGCR